jgi:hypothetical protein
MRRRLLLSGLFALPFAGVGRAAAQAGQIGLRIAGPVRGAQATFRLTNRLGEAITYASWDGGGVHNGLMQLVGGTWTDVGLGYCGLGLDGDVTIAPGRSHDFRAYVGTTAGRFRITLDVARASGANETVLSTPFVVP